MSDATGRKTSKAAQDQQGRLARPSQTIFFFKIKRKNRRNKYTHYCPTACASWECLSASLSEKTMHMFTMAIAMLIVSCTVASNETVTINLPNGDGAVMGIATPFVHEFHAIPYAEPPVGPLRWRRPKKNKAWKPQVKDGTKWSLNCAQDYYKSGPDWPGK